MIEDFFRSTFNYIQQSWTAVAAGITHIDKAVAAGMGQIDSSTAAALTRLSAALRAATGSVEGATALALTKLSNALRTPTAEIEGATALALTKLSSALTSATGSVEDTLESALSKMRAATRTQNAFIVEYLVIMSKDMRDHLYELAAKESLERRTAIAKVEATISDVMKFGTVIVEFFSDPGEWVFQSIDSFFERYW